MKTDHLFYRLFQEHPEVVFELTGWPLPPAAGYTLHAEEVKQTSFRLDGVLMPAETAPDAPMVFLEAQSQPDDGFYPRWFTSIFLLLYRQGRDCDWRAVVIYPNRATEKPPPRAFAPLLDLPGVHRIYLEDLADHPATTPGLQLAQLIVAEPIVAAAQTQALLDRYRDRLNDPRIRQFFDFVETILIYKLPHLTREEIQAMLHWPEIDIKQTRVYQDALAEGRQEGRQEGRREAEEESKKREAALVLRLLRRRFGPLAPVQQARIQALSVTDLEALGEALLDFQTVTELTAWLERQP
jgi:predicted transposase/invertase (TIGR01784 family)